MGWSKLRETRVGVRTSCVHVLVGIFVCLLCWDIASAQVQTQFQLLSLNSSFIACGGNSSLTPHVEGLKQAACLTPFPCTSGATYNTSIAGTCSYINPLQLSHGTLSFSTMFSFNTLKFPTFEPGDGFTFFLSPSKPDSSGAAGGYLGWLNATTNGDPNGHNFAVEFDLVNETLDGIPYNSTPGYAGDDHVGVDVNSLNSVITDNLQGTTYLSSLSSAQQLHAWIDYDGVKKWIYVSLNQESKKPCEPIISQSLDLSAVLLPTMYAGFSASTGGPENFNTQTTVFDWSFSSDGRAPNIFGDDEKCGLKLSIAAILGIVVGILVLAIIIMSAISVFFYWRTRKTAHLVARQVSDLEREKAHLVAELKQLDFGAREYTYDEMWEATRGFEKQIGRGGFGTVYKGNLSYLSSYKRGNGTTTVAVKKINSTSDCADDAKQLVAEVKVIGRLRHVNIVPLIGWCYEQGQMLLVYKYIENGDLDQQLFPEDYGIKGDKIFPWEKRMGVLRGVAAALKFLHEDFESEQIVLHRDIKTRNILIDGNFNGRLGDFGLARLCDRNNEGHQSSQVFGTVGYMAPEFPENGAAVETDVFSFGVMTLVVATGRQAIDKSKPGHNLVKWVRQLYDEGRIQDAVDLKLLNNDSSFDRKEMERVLRVGLLCCVFNSRERPPMRDVVNALENTREGTIPIFSCAMPQQGPTCDSLKFPAGMDDDDTIDDQKNDDQNQPFYTAKQASSDDVDDVV